MPSAPSKPIYPLAQEQALLARLPALLRDELAVPGSARDTLVALAREQQVLGQTGLLGLILIDIHALVDAPWSEWVVSVPTDEGRRVADRDARFAHVLARLEQYGRSAPQDDFAPSLFRGSVCRVDHDGRSIRVEEVARLEGYSILCRDPATGRLYLEYVVPRGIVDLPRTYALSDDEAAAFARGTLDLPRLLRRLGA